jgi:hypothetical protein
MDATFDPNASMPVNSLPTPMRLAAGLQPAQQPAAPQYTGYVSHAQVSDHLYEILRQAQEHGAVTPDQTKTRDDQSDKPADHSAPATNGGAHSQSGAPRRTRAFSPGRLVDASYAHNFIRQRQSHMNDLVKSKIWSSKKLQIYTHKMAKRFQATAEATHEMRQAAGSAASSPMFFMATMRHLDMEADGFHDIMKSMITQMSDMNHEDADLMHAGVDVPSDIVATCERERAAGNGMQIESPNADDGDIEEAADLVPEADTAHLGEIPQDDMDWGKSSFMWANGDIQGGLVVFRDAVHAMEQGVNISLKLEDPKAYGQWKDAPVRYLPRHSGHGVGAAAGAGNTMGTHGSGAGKNSEQPQNRHDDDDDSQKKQEPQGVDGINALGASIALRRLKSEMAELQEMADSVDQTSG